MRPPNARKELRHLSKNLRLTRDQRVGVSSILEERTREIHLLLDVQSLSQEYRNTLAAKVMENSNAQIVTLLRNKQKQKFTTRAGKRPRNLLASVSLPSSCLTDAKPRNHMPTAEKSNKTSDPIFKKQD